jgi:hypothetical protein
MPRLYSLATIQKRTEALERQRDKLRADAPNSPRLRRVEAELARWDALFLPAVWRWIEAEVARRNRQ